MESEIHVVGFFDVLTVAEKYLRLHTIVNTCDWRKKRKIKYIHVLVYSIDAKFLST